MPSLMTRRLRPALLALLGLSACATSGMIRSDELAQAAKKRADYVEHLARLDAAQMQLGRLAMTRSDNLRVRAYGQALYDEHSHHLEALQQWAQARGQEASAARQIDMGFGVGGSGVTMAPELPQDLTRYQDLGNAHEISGKALNGIDKLEGTRFDRKVLRLMRSTQEETRSLLVDGSKTYSADPVFASLLVKTEPLVASELKQTERLIQRVD